MYKTIQKSSRSKRKRGMLRIILFSLLGLILIGSFIFTYWLGKQVATGLLYQNVGNDTKSNSVKQLEKWGYDLAAFESAYTPEHFTLTAEDDTTVPAYSFTTNGEADNNTVILVHGAGGDHVSVYPVAEIYLQNGWNVITFDQRASGDSLNELVTFGYYEKLDVKALVDYARNKVKNNKVVVHGISMGAATSGLYASTDHAKDNLDYVIMDSSYDSMENIFLAVWNSMDESAGLPERYVLWSGNLYITMHYGFGFDNVDIVAAQKSNELPTLIIQGTKDSLCPPAMGEQIYENIASSEKELWMVDSAHVEAYIDYPEQYATKVMEFLK